MMLRRGLAGIIAAALLGSPSVSLTARPARAGAGAAAISPATHQWRVHSIGSFTAPAGRSLTCRPRMYP